jgi:hypothetical protein
MSDAVPRGSRQVRPRPPGVHLSVIRETALGEGSLRVAIQYRHPLLRIPREQGRRDP